MFKFPWRSKAKQEATEQAQQALEAEVQRAYQRGLSQGLGAGLVGPSASLHASPSVVPYLPKDSKRELYGLDNPWIYSVWHSTLRRPGAQVNLAVLRTLADTYDVVRACIEHLKREVRTTPFQIVPYDSTDQSDATTRDIEAAWEWFRPGGGCGGKAFNQRRFEMQIFEDVLVLGAFAVYNRFTYGGKLYESSAIDSATIRPRVDTFGWIDEENPFEQQVQGVAIRSFTMDEITYDGLYPVTNSPYYRSPIEYLLRVVYTALKADEWNTTWLSDGNVPDSLISVPDTWTPDQVLQYADYFDALLSGDSRNRHKVKIVPGGTKSVLQQTRKEADFQEFEFWLMRRTCSIFGVQPTSIGYAGDQYKTSQENSNDQTTQFGAGSLLAMREDLYNRHLRMLGFPHLCIKHVFGRDEKPKDRAFRLAVLVKSNIMTVNEARSIEGLPPRTEGDILIPIDVPLKLQEKSIDNARVSAGSKGGGQSPPSGKLDTFGTEPGTSLTANDTGAGAGEHLEQNMREGIVYKNK
jgi:hypothetical protein